MCSILECGGVKLPCARLAIRIRESGAAVDDLSSVKKPPYFATTFRQKVRLFAPFLDSKVAPGASFWPFRANSCFYLSFCHRTSRRNKSWIEWTGIKLRMTLSKKTNISPG